MILALELSTLGLSTARPAMCSQAYGLAGVAYGLAGDLEVSGLACKNAGIPARPECGSSLAEKCER